MWGFPLPWGILFVDLGHLAVCLWVFFCIILMYAAVCSLLFLSERSIWVSLSRFLLILGAFALDNSTWVFILFFVSFSFFLVWLSVCIFYFLLLSAAILSSFSTVEYTSPIFGTPSVIPSIIFLLIFSCFFVSFFASLVFFFFSYFLFVYWSVFH